MDFLRRKYRIVDFEYLSYNAIVFGTIATIRCRREEPTANRRAVVGQWCWAFTELTYFLTLLCVAVVANIWLSRLAEVSLPLAERHEIRVC